jgi:hypothetical protein
MRQDIRTTWVVVVFSIFMAGLEAAVVVYLRALYYPDGFTVAFKVIDENILLTELVRELATIIMLLSVGYLAGKNFNHRFAWFLFSFAVWDIFYYGWLKIFLDWPSSLLEWDILFLIPITWLGPVLSPVICSLTMILLSVVLLRKENVRINRWSWALLLAGVAVILYTYMKDYGALLIENDLMGDYTQLLKNQRFIDLASSYVPDRYSWGIFAVGEGLLLLAIYVIYREKK